MGCGASVPDDYVGGGRKSSRHRSYQRSPGSGAPAAGAEEVSTMTQSTLGEMRQRSKSGDSQSSVPLWIEKICKPERDDNADLYDPIRRHQLSMDSVEVRQNRKETTASRTSSGQSESGSAVSQTSSAQGGSEQAATVTLAVTQAAASECRTEKPVADESGTPDPCRVVKPDDATARDVAARIADDEDGGVVAGEGQAEQSENQ